AASTSSLRRRQRYARRWRRHRHGRLRRDPGPVSSHPGLWPWEVNGGAEGTDTLFNIEIVRHGGGRYLLVGDGGLAHPAAPTPAATQADPTILVPAPPINPVLVDLPYQDG